jgi:hypothetical protein
MPGWLAAIGVESPVCHRYGDPGPVRQSNWNAHSWATEHSVASR